MRDLICGVDTGGTFTDSVILGDGLFATGKAPSTPREFSAGVFASLRRSAARLGIGLDEVLDRTERLVVGTTVGTNAFLERRGARLGLITTRGFGDTLHIMRGVGRTTGLSPHDTMMLEHSRKPDPLVPKSLIRELAERTDSEGEVLVEVDPEAVATAARELVAAGCDAIAVCFLWSFKNDRNERVARAAIERSGLDVYLSCSHEIAPKLGEYERFAATAINAYIGPVTLRYVDSIRRRCEQEGYTVPPLIMQCSGGVMSGELVERQAIVTLNSGPAGGVTGSAHLARALGVPNVITADAGGTSFDVGLIRDGEILQGDKMEIGQFEFFIPAIDVHTIGAGGGSLAHVDEVRKVMSVGPQSAGAEPGPICYGRGGTRPTLSDAALVLGYLAEVTSLDTSGDDEAGAGRGVLELQAALDGIEALGARIGISGRDAAIGIVRIAESHMADLIRRAVVAAGLDPREFTVFAYGGAGPIHAAGFARDLNVRSVVIPMGDTASVWSAYGVAISDVKHVREYASVFSEPFDLAAIGRIFEDLVARAEAAFERERVDLDEVAFRYELGIRYSMQLNEVYVEVDGPRLDPDAMAATIERFERKYAQIFGAEAGFRDAGVELVDFRVTATAESAAPPPVEREVTTPLREAERAARRVYFVGAGVDDYVESAVYDGAALPTDVTIAGPAIVELAGTSVVVPPDYAVLRDRTGSLVLTMRERAGAARDAGAREAVGGTA